MDGNPPEADAVHGLGTRKNDLVLELIAQQRVEPSRAPSASPRPCETNRCAAPWSLFEDAQAGVEAGRAGNFGWVVGVDRTGQAEALRRRGADVVVTDLGELLEAM